MKYLIFYIALFCFGDLHAQHLNDLKRQSLFGNVKKITRYRYSNVRWRNNMWEPKDTSVWERREIMEFDESGNVDTEKETYKSKTTNKTLITKYKQLHDTTTSITLDDMGSVTFTSKVIWKSRKLCESYFVDSVGKVTSVLRHLYLDSNNSKATSEVRTFDKDSVLLGGYYGEYFLENNLITREIIIDFKSKDVWNSFYTYTKFDGPGNPAELHISSKKNKKPTKIVVTQYEYY